MKKHLAVLLLFGIILYSNVCLGQGKTLKQLKKDDSAKVANMPQAVKDNFAKLFPNAKKVKWSVLDYVYMAGFNPNNPEAEHYNENDGRATVSFYHGGDKDTKWWRTEIKYTRWESMNAAIPAKVLTRINAELKAQNNEQVETIEYVTCDDSCITSSKVKDNKFCKIPCSNTGYYVWGNKTGLQTGGTYTFNSNGDYVPVVDYDNMQRKKKGLPH